MKYIFILIFILFFSLNKVAFSQVNCRDFFSDGSKFLYYNGAEVLGAVTIKGDVFAEKYFSQKTFFKSRYEWLSDCSFKLTVIKIRGELEGNIGYSLVVKITKIVGNRAYYVCEGFDDTEEQYYEKINNKR